MDLENSRIMASLTVGEFKEVIGAVLDEKIKMLYPEYAAY